MNTNANTTHTSPIVGLGLRHPHYDDILSKPELNKNIDFVEVHAENFFAPGGISRQLLLDVKDKYPISIHGTSLGLGSRTDIPSLVLQNFAELVQSSDAFLVSEHLCFNRAMLNDKLVHSGDLLPIAYNESSLQVLVNKIEQVQSLLKRPILIENLSAYLKVEDLDLNEKDSFSEVEFLIELCHRSGCGLLLDINNLIVNAINQGQQNIIESIQKTLVKIPKNLIGEIHLAGFTQQQVFGFVVDDHAQAVSEECWTLYKTAIELFGYKPTLIEWDNNLPEWEVLVKQVDKAKSIALSTSG